MFGGRQAARSVHFILSFGFVAFTFGHVLMVLTTGVLNNMRSMTSGWYREKASTEQEPARLETPTEEMAQEPCEMPAAKPLRPPELERSSPAQYDEAETPESARQESAIGKPKSTLEHQPPADPSGETSAAASKEAKTDVGKP